jgi:hypothetical protein
LEAIPGIRDHEIVFVDSNIAISRQKPVKRKIYMWKKADTQKLKSKIEEMSNSNPGLSYSCGSCFRWYTFLHYISALGLEVIPQSVNVGVNFELFQYVV